MNINNITKDWTHADAFLNKKIEDVSTEVNDSKTNILSTVVASSNATASNAKTLEFQGTGKALEQLKIEGKTSQDGTPSPSVPVEVKGVGDKTYNILPASPVVSTTINGITFKSDGKGTYSISGTATADAGYNFPISGFKLPKSISKGGTGCIYSNNSKAYSSDTVVMSFRKGDTQVTGWSPISVNRVHSEYEFLNGTTENDIIDTFRILVKSGKTVSDTYKVMVTANSKNDNVFVPYGYQIPISCGGKTSNIYLDKPLRNYEKLDLASRTVEHIYKTVTLTGNEAWQESTTAVSGFKGYVYPRAIEDYRIISSDGINAFNIYSNEIAHGTSNMWSSKVTERFVCGSGGSVNIRVPSSEASTLTEWINYLKNRNSSGNPLTIIYESTTITKETFDAPEIATSIGKNTLAVGTDVTPAKVEVTSFGEYYSKIEVDKMLAEKANASDIPTKITASSDFSNTLSVDIPNGFYDVSLFASDSSNARYKPSKYLLRITLTNNVPTAYLTTVAEGADSRKISTLSVDANNKVTITFTNTSYYSLTFVKI